MVYAPTIPDAHMFMPTLLQSLCGVLATLGTTKTSLSGDTAGVVVAVLFFHLGNQFKVGY